MINFSPADDRYIYELLSKNIKYYKLHNNSKFSNYVKITHEKLAELCDLSHNLISDIESAKIQQSFSLAVLYRISKVLEIYICMLFERRDENGHLFK